MHLRRHLRRRRRTFGSPEDQWSFTKTTSDPARPSCREDIDALRTVHERGGVQGRYPQRAPLRRTMHLLIEVRSFLLRPVRTGKSEVEAWALQRCT